MIPRRTTIVTVSYGDDDGDSDVDDVTMDDKDEEDTSHCITRLASRERLDIAANLYHNQDCISRSCRRIRAPAGPQLYILGERRRIASLFSLSDRRLRRGDPREWLPSRLLTKHEQSLVLCITRVCVCVYALTLFSKSATRQSRGHPGTWTVHRRQGMSGIGESRANGNFGELYLFFISCRRRLSTCFYHCLPPILLSTLFIVRYRTTSA